MKQDKKTEGQELVDGLPENVVFSSEKIIDYYLNGQHYYHRSNAFQTLLIETKARVVYEEQYPDRKFESLREDLRDFWRAEAQSVLKPRIEKIEQDLRDRRDQELRDIGEMILDHQPVVKSKHA